MPSTTFLTAPADRPMDFPPEMTFERLATSYNFRYPFTRHHLFSHLVAQECAARPKPVRALDIGCGHGMNGERATTEHVRRHVDELWGLEPDPGIPPSALFAHFQHATMEEATLPPGSIDVAYSYTVMEHVTDPVRFMTAVYQALKPGGSYLFLTINGVHYFALIAGTLRAMKLDEAVLRLVRGKQKVESYHYPVAYKFNTQGVIDRVCREVGFEAPEYAYMEQKGPEPYMRGPLRPLLHLLNYKRDAMRNPGALLELVCRIRKPG